MEAGSLSGKAVPQDAAEDVKFNGVWDTVRQ